jgi:hypothetical protein
MGIRYRLWQFWQAVYHPPLSDEARRQIGAVLTPAEAGLFGRFSQADQVHGYRVMRALQAEGHSHPALLAAALLHDVGKTRVRWFVWDRVAVVVGRRLGVGKTAVFSQNPPTGWRKPFVVRARHPAWGAEMAAAVGSSPLTVALIRRHQDEITAVVTEEDKLLHALQWADNQN